MVTPKMNNNEENEGVAFTELSEDLQGNTENSPELDGEESRIKTVLNQQSSIIESLQKELIHLKYRNDQITDQLQNLNNSSNIDNNTLSDFPKETSPNLASEPDHSEAGPIPIIGNNSWLSTITNMIAMLFHPETLGQLQNFVLQFMQMWQAMKGSSNNNDNSTVSKSIERRIINLFLTRVSKDLLKLEKASGVSAETSEIVHQTVY